MDTRNFNSIQLEQTSEYIKDAPIEQSHPSLLKLSNKNINSPNEVKKTKAKKRNSEKMLLSQSRRIKKTNNWASDKTRTKAKKSMAKKKGGGKPRVWKN